MKKLTIKIRSNMKAGVDNKVQPLYGIATPLYGIARPLYGVAVPLYGINT